MSWRQLAKHTYTAAKFTASGATITLGSTVISCALALQIEAASHRTLFRFFPHWYANVEHANGIPDEMLATVRIEAQNAKKDAARMTRFQEQQQALLTSTSKDQSQQLENREDMNQTIFNIEEVLRPARKQLKEISDFSFANDMSACAMTA